jgi:hypothetical protein
MQGPHKTILTYFYGEVDKNGDCPTLEVGEVTCVPRVGELVYIGNDKPREVSSVTWSPDSGGRPITWVGVNLSHRPSGRRSRLR